jgi:hypothetical protein
MRNKYYSNIGSQLLKFARVTVILFHNHNTNAIHLSVHKQEHGVTKTDTT